jgi:hypothetical protein
VTEQISVVPARDVHVSYGPPMEFFDEDSEIVRYVKRRYATWVEHGMKFGRWDFVPFDHPETDALRSQ